MYLSVRLIPVVACQWQATPPVRRLRQQGLVDIQTAAPKCMGSARHVEPPDPVGCVAGDLTSLFRVRFQSFDPMVKSQAVVFSQALNISHLEATQFCRSNAGADRHQVGIGKHVAVREGRPSSVIDSGMGDSVIQEHTAGPQQVPRPVEVLRKESFADMLKHTDTYDFVVFLVMINVTVIGNFHAAAIVQSRGPQAFSRHLRLRHAQV